MVAVFLLFTELRMYQDRCHMRKCGWLKAQVDSFWESKPEIPYQAVVVPCVKQVFEGGGVPCWFSCRGFEDKWH
jgi:hypothetical protein